MSEIVTVKVTSSWLRRRIRSRKTPTHHSPVFPRYELQKFRKSPDEWPFSRIATSALEA